MRIGLVLCLCLMVLGCAQTQPTKFYTLATAPITVDKEGSATEPQWRRLALAPVSLPAYLDRPQFVIRLDATRMQIADFDSWIEPLDLLVQRTIAINLERDHRIGQVLKLPQRRSIEFDIGVEIQIDQFEARADNIAVIDADWLLIDGKEQEMAGAGFIAQLPVPAPAGFAERSEALSLLLEKLAATILQALPKET